MKTEFVLIALASMGALALTTAFADQPITPIYTGARQIELDFDWDTGNYFAVVRGEDGVNHYWKIFRSSDNGGLWLPGGGVSSTGAFEDVEMAVAGDWVYVAAARGGPTAGIGEIVRFSAVDGLRDTDYGFPVIVDVSPATVVDVALASNQDGPDTQI